MTELPFYDVTVLSLGALFLGIILLIKGGNWAVDSAVHIATRYGISPMVVGFTIIAFGTSLPELVISVFANLQGSPGIALGNVVGSNIANILLVLGFTALFTTLMAKVSRELMRDLVFMLLVTLALLALLHYGMISRFMGAMMLLVLFGYVFYQFKTTAADDFDADELADISFNNDMVAFGTLALGLISIAVGAEFLVKGARVSATLIGVPESVIALSLIALGTSLPELSTSIAAARKGQSGMVIGNIIGSNVFNILMIIGVAALVKPIFVDASSAGLAAFDSWVTLGVSVLLMAVVFTLGRIGRVTGSFFFVGYLFYNAYIYLTNMEVSL